MAGARPGATLVVPDEQRTVRLDDLPLPRRRGGVPRRRVAAAVLVGALLGGAAGLGAVHAGSKSRSAALLDLTLAVSVADGSSPSTDQADRFVQSELLYLNSRTFERSVLAAAPTPVPATLSATQVGNTDVVQIVAEAARGEVAVRTADAAVQVYADHRRALLSEQATALQQQLTAAQRALDEGDGASSATLQARAGALEAQYADAHAAAEDPDAGGTLVESAADAGYQPSASATVAVAEGAALGVLVALLLAVVPRLVSRRVTTPDDVPDDGGVALRPTLPAVGEGWLEHLRERPSGDRLETASRLLAGRLSGQLADGRPLVLVGASRRCGTSFAAVNLGTALARRGRTVLVAAGDVVDGQVGRWFGVPADAPGLAELRSVRSLRDVEAALRKTTVDGLRLLTAASSDRWEPVEAALAGQALRLLLDAGWTVVVDCPPPDVSSAATELAPLRPVVVVVAAAGHTTQAEVTDAAASAPGPVATLLTGARRRRRLRRWKR